VLIQTLSPLKTVIYKLLNQFTETKELFANSHGIHEVCRLFMLTATPRQLDRKSLMKLSFIKEMYILSE